MPTARAVKKWPISWIRISSARPRMATSTLTSYLPPLCGVADDRAPTGSRVETRRVAFSYGCSFREAPRFPVGFGQVGQVTGRCAGDLGQRLFDRRSNPEERQAAFEE